LTPRSGDLPEEGDERLWHQAQTVLKRKNIDSKLVWFVASLSNEAAENYASLQDLFMEGYEGDKFPNEILLQLRNGEKKSSKITQAECTEKEGKL
jgi:hypothetical protein